jgi:hypothetical protein
MTFPQFKKSLDPSGQVQKFEFRLQLDPGVTLLNASITDVDRFDEPTTDGALEITLVIAESEPDADGITGVSCYVRATTPEIANTVRLLRCRYTKNLTPPDNQGSDCTMRLRIEQT